MAMTPSRYGNLFWLDMETNGFNPEGGRILEIAIVITTPELEIVDIEHVLIDFPEGEEESWSQWCRLTHRDNGLIDECHQKGIPLDEACTLLCMFMDMHIKNHRYADDEDQRVVYRPPLCGAGVGFDRKWLEYHMPSLIRMFSYRNLDISVFYELLARSKRDFSDIQEDLPDYPHRAINDIHRSIELLRRYKKVLEF